MDGRKRFQFSVWNLMLMVALWAVLFWNARVQQEKSGWTVWLGAAYMGALPAVGALLGGWQGMWKGFGWTWLIALAVCAVAAPLGLLAVGAQSLSGGGSPMMEPPTWIVCAAVMLVTVGSAIGARREGSKGAKNALGWLFGGGLICYFSMGAIYLLALFIQSALAGAAKYPEMSTIGVTAVMVGGLPAIGAVVGWLRGSKFWFDTAVVLAVLSVFLVFIGCLAVFIVRVAFHR